MKQKRIVCVVVDDGENWSAINGQDFEQRLEETLLAYEFTPEGVEAVRQTLMGNLRVVSDSTIADNEPTSYCWDDGTGVPFRNLHGEKTNDDPI